MKPLAYVETSVISYLTSRPSRDLVVAGHQQVTREWWDRRRQSFHLVASELVAEEAAAGDEEAAKARLAVLEEIERLEGPLPERASEDALHIAIAVTNGCDFLLTWNHKHLANAAMRASIERICRRSGYEPSVLCTPEDLLEG